jgi:hypothetical protein
LILEDVVGVSVVKVDLDDRPILDARAKLPARAALPNENQSRFFFITPSLRQIAGVTNRVSRTPSRER